MEGPTRSLLDRELAAIRGDILRLGRMVENQVRRAAQALRDVNPELARYVLAADLELDQLRYQLEGACLGTIATQQPTAVDLRVIVAAMHIATELERMGDHAKGIAAIALRLSEQPPLKPPAEIARMADIVCDMTRMALDAFVRRDAALARDIIDRDDEIDSQYVQVVRELITGALSDRAAIARAMYLLWVVHNLERIGDRATNLCERVIFAATGELADLKPSGPVVAQGGA